MQKESSIPQDTHSGTNVYWAIRSIPNHKLVVPPGDPEEIVIDAVEDGVFLRDLWEEKKQNISSLLKTQNSTSSVFATDNVIQSTEL